MENKEVVFFPVGNGDTSLHRISNGQNILIDCKIDNDADRNSEKFDVKAELLKVLPQDESNRRHLDVFILTHPDNDHCAGFKDTFFCDDPNNYDQDARDRNAIIIDELWFSNTLFKRFTKPLSDAAKNFKKEAKRRKDLYQSNRKQAEKAGNRLVIIDFKDDCKDDGLDDIIVEPGTSTSRINHQEKADFSIFVHAPFKTPTPDSQDRNETSIIMQFRYGSSTDPMASIAMFAGDADYNRFARLLRERDDESIEWDLLLAPHHCSWTFFNMTPQQDFPNPQESAIEYLRRQRGDGIVIASSKKIEDDDDNPPHHAAMEEYCRNIKKENFYSTGDRPLEPLKFTITSLGFRKASAARVASTSIAINSVTDRPKTYG